MKYLTVLISGVLSEVERALAVFLSKNGFRISAGLRNEPDENILQKNAPGKILPLFIDIPDPISTKNVSDTVVIETDGELFALINNSGLGLSACAASNRVIETITDFICLELDPLKIRYLLSNSEMSTIR